jgi:hypothetical protein
LEEENYLMRFPLLLVAAATATVLVACGEKVVRVQAPAEANGASTSPLGPFDRNLLSNGDAETLVSGSKEAIEGWSKTADVLGMNYGGMPDEWQSSKPGCPDGRERYFRLGLAINEPSKSINQKIHVNGAEADIDAGLVECALGGWFGGWVGGDASARLEVDFLGEDGSVLGKLATDAPDPAALTKPELGRAALVKLVVSGPVPPKVRRLEVRLVAIRPTGKVDTNAVAAADSLSVVLRKKRN